jgi:hypothetical protein
LNRKRKIASNIVNPRTKGFYFPLGVRASISKEPRDLRI